MDPLYEKLRVRLVKNVTGSYRMAQTVEMEVVHVSALVAIVGMFISMLEVSLKIN